MKAISAPQLAGLIVSVTPVRADVGSGEQRFCGQLYAGLSEEKERLRHTLKLALTCGEETSGAF